MNKRGFALLETLIASTFVLSVLIFLYIQFINLKNNYENSFKYNTIPGLYIARNIVDYISETGYSKAITNLTQNSKPYVWLNVTNTSGTIYSEIIATSNIEKILLTKNDTTEIKHYLKTNDDNSIDNDMKKFILKIADSDSNNTGYRIIIKYKDGTFATVIDPNTL